VRPGGSLIVTDFHPDAYSRGWQRTFHSDGQLYEIEIHPYSVESLFGCADQNGLVLQNAMEPAFGEPERAIFERAGKPDLFDQVREIPAILLARWTKP